MCARCGKQVETEACLEEHDRDVHEHNNIVCAKDVHGVENILKPGIACRNTASMNMLAVALDVQGVKNCCQRQNTCRNILHTNMNERRVKKNQNLKT